MSPRSSHPSPQRDLLYAEGYFNLARLKHTFARNQPNPDNTHKQQTEIRPSSVTKSTPPSVCVAAALAVNGRAEREREEEEENEIRIKKGSVRNTPSQSPPDASSVLWVPVNAWSKLQCYSEVRGIPLYTPPKGIQEPKITSKSFYDMHRKFVCVAFITVVHQTGPSRRQRQRHRGRAVVGCTWDA